MDKNRETTYSINLQGVSIRSMSLRDIEAGMRLSQAEGWNQTQNDWRLFIEDPQNICLLAECDNKIIATTTSINYADAEAWIGMVLVDKEYRGRGVSKSLLSIILEKLSAFPSIKLDATDSGRPVYQKFGFKDEYLVSRMLNQSVQPLPLENSILQTKDISIKDLEEVIALDAEVFGINRKQLIEFLVKRHPHQGKLLRREGKVAAFALGREGYRYYQIGPVVAPSIADTKILISSSILNLVNQSVVVDVLSEKQEMVEWLESIGFTHQRDFVRMYKGDNHFPGKTENLFLICGPEFG